MTTGDLYYFCPLCNHLYNLAGCPTHGNQYSPPSYANKREDNHELLEKIIEELKSDLYILGKMKRAHIEDENWDGLVYIENRKDGMVRFLEILSNHSVLDFEETIEHLGLRRK